MTQLITKEKEVQHSAVKLHAQQEQLSPQVIEYLLEPSVCNSVQKLCCAALN